MPIEGQSFRLSFYISLILISSQRIALILPLYYPAVAHKNLELNRLMVNIIMVFCFFLKDDGKLGEPLKVSS